MKINNLIKDFSIEKDDSIYLIILSVFCLSIISIKILGYKKIGIPDSDVIIYLCNALYYAGLNSNGVGGVGYLYSSPVICFLTAILFKLWHVSPTPILLVTGIFEFLGNIGLYILLKQRFNRTLSFVGTMIYVTSALFVLHSASGMLDIPAVAISIWILIFSILSIDKNYKYYLIAIPLFVIGIFTRPTVGFMLPLIILYFLYNHDIFKLFDDSGSDKRFSTDLLIFLKSNEFKYIFISTFIAIVIAIIIIAYHSFVFNLDLPFIRGVQDSMGNYNHHKSWDYYYNVDTFFYIKMIPQFFILNEVNVFNSILFYVVLSVVILGLIFKFSSIIKKIYGEKNKPYFKSKNLESILKVSVVIFFILGIFCFKINYMITEVLFFLGFVICASLLKKFSFNHHDLGLTIIIMAFFVFYFIFISHINIKMERYFLPLFVPICYFVMYAFEGILEYFDISLDNNDVKSNKEVISKIILVLFVIILMFNAVSEINHNFDSVYSNRYNDYQSTTIFLMKHDPNYADKNITTDRFHRYYSWFLNVPTQNIDTKQYPVSTFDSCGSDYIILGKKVKFENYTRIYHEGDSYLYQRRS